MQGRIGKTLPDIKTGCILTCHDASGKRKHFAVVAMSYHDYALLSIFRLSDLPQKILEGDQLCLLPEGLNDADEAVYADCSRLIVRRSGIITAWLKKHPECCNGTLSYSTIFTLIEKLKESVTISVHQKKEFNLLGKQR